MTTETKTALNNVNAVANTNLAEVKFVIPVQDMELNGSIRFVTNPDHRDFGMCTIYTESFFTPLSIPERMPLSDALVRLQAIGAIFTK